MEDVTNHQNSYKVYAITPLSGTIDPRIMVELEQFAYIEANAFSVVLDAGTLRLEIETTGSGELLNLSAYVSVGIR